MNSPEPQESLEALLADRAWLRRVALALAGDENTADDLEQEAYLAAMRRPPQAVAAIRGWVRRVMTNRMHQIGRTRARVRRREMVAAKSDALAPTDEVVARAEAQRNVVLAVFDLDEPYRTTVLLRYFENLSSVEIGRRLEVPANTVRVRVGRALHQLRGRLDTKYGARSKWLTLLGVSAAASTASAATATAAGASGASFALLKFKPLLLLSLLAGAVLMISAIRWWSDDKRSAERTMETAREQDGRDGPGADQAPAKTRMAHVASGASLFPGQGSISGEVRHASNGAAVAARVRIRRDGKSLEVTTGPGGYFAFVDLAPGGPYELDATAPSCTPARVAGIALEPAERAHLGTLWMDAPMRVRVRVTDVAGKTVAGAKVQAFRTRTAPRGQDRMGQQPRAVSSRAVGADGVALFPDLSPAPWTFRAEAPGYAPAGLQTQALLRGGTDQEFRLVLERGHALTGVVYGADGKPVSGAVVLALRPREAEGARPLALDPLGVRTTSGDEGRYEFAALTRGAHAIAVLPGQGLTCRIGVIEIPAVTEFEIRLDGGTLAGTVTDAESGAAIAGADVRAAVWRRHSPTYLSAVTNAQGQYTIHVPLGGAVQGPARGYSQSLSASASLRVLKPGYVLVPGNDRRQWSSPLLLRTDRLEWNFKLRRAATLSGVVAGPDGPLAGVGVTVDVWDEFRGSQLHRVTTNESGRYRVQGLPKGRALVRLEKAGLIQEPGVPMRWSKQVLENITVAIPEAGEVEHDLIMVAAGELKGQVVDDAQRPLDGAVVEIRDANGATWTASTNLKGEFWVSGPARQSDVVVHVRRDGYASAKESARAGKSDPIVVALRRTGRVTGRVRGASGLAGAFVQVAPATVLDSGSYGIASIWQRVEKIAVDADGRFDAPLPWFDGAIEKGFYIRASANGYAPAVSEKLKFAGGDVVQGGTLTLDKGHTLHGRIVDKNGAGPVAGARVEIVNQKIPRALGETRNWSMTGRSMHPFEIVGVSDAEGRFVIENLPAWTYEFRISARNYMGTVMIGAVPGETLRVELLPSFEIAGHVQYADGTKIASAPVVAFGPNGRAGNTTTNAEGKFVFRWLVAGNYRFEVQPGISDPVDVIVKRSAPVAAGARDVVLTVERGAGTISGRAIGPDGTPMPGASVSAKPLTGGRVLRVRANPDGTFVLRGLENKSYTIAAGGGRTLGGPKAQGLALVAELSPVRPGATGVVLAFQVGQVISGKVLGVGGAPVPAPLGVRLQRQPESKWSLYLAVNADGSFQFTNLVPGRYQIAITDRATGKVLAAQGPASAVAGGPSLTFEVRASTTMEGKVVDATGKPVAEAQVLAYALDGTDTRTAWTNLRGEFRLTGLNSTSRYDVAAIQHSRGGSKLADLAPGAMDLMLKLAPNTTLAAQLLDSAGQPVPNALIAISYGKQQVNLYTDSRGHFSTCALPDGDYAVAVRAIRGRDLKKPVAVGRVRSGQADAVLRLGS